MAGAAQGAPAAAAVINASSAAFGESVSITSAPPLGLTLNVGSGPLPTAAGPLQRDANGGERLCDRHPFHGGADGHGIVGRERLSGARTANASSTVNSLAIAILGVLGLTADTVFSSADISGSPGALLPLAAPLIITCTARSFAS